MSNIMTYKGYSARIDYDDDDGIFFGRIAGIRDGVGFHADTVAALREAFHDAVEDYIETCAKIGKRPQKAFSGQVMFRVKPMYTARPRWPPNCPQEPESMGRGCSGPCGGRSHASAKGSFAPCFRSTRACRPPACPNLNTNL